MLLTENIVHHACLLNATVIDKFKGGGSSTITRPSGYDRSSLKIWLLRVGGQEDDSDSIKAAEPYTYSKAFVPIKTVYPKTSSSSFR